MANKNKKIADHINPILGVIMKKENNSVIYNWSIIFPESGSTLIYQKDHGLTNSSGNNEETIIINKDWYKSDYDVEF